MRRASLLEQYQGVMKLEVKEKSHGVQRRIVSILQVILMFFGDKDVLRQIRNLGAVSHVCMYIHSK